MLDWIQMPFVALYDFYQVSPGGALGVIVGVGGCVGMPAVYKLLENRVPKLVATPIAAASGLTLAGVCTLLFTGFMNTSVPTHDMALQAMNQCESATELLGSPIETASIGGGQYRSEGGFGHSSWNMKVQGPEGKARLAYAMEMHGGEWGFTNLNLKVGKKRVTLSDCF
jgi:hypothetical protein